MKRISLVAVLLGALAFAGIASAANNGTQVSQFKTAYTDMNVGPVSCSGVHQVKKDGTVQESETCKSTTGQPLQYYAPGQVVTFGGGAWQSDFDHSSIATSGTYTISADGMSYTILANY